MDDPRLTPARPDLAAKYLEGKVKAARFVEGEEFEITDAIAPLREAPSPDAALLTQALKGERVTIYDRTGEGCAWGQLNSDGYVGWLPDRALSKPGDETDAQGHRAPDVRLSRPLDQAAADRDAGDGALLSVIARGRRVRRHRARAGICRASIVGGIDGYEKDFVAVAERFVGTPYLWGGKSSLGIDCSGLVQVSLNAAGTGCPRDSDMQQDGLGRRLRLAESSHLQRGDLIFWKGHVAIVRDADTIVHANAHHMATVIENTREAIARIKAAAARYPRSSGWIKAQWSAGEPIRHLSPWGEVKRPTPRPRRRRRLPAGRRRRTARACSRSSDA